MRAQMRRLLGSVLLLAACTAYAQKPPPGLEPLPEPPPPPPMPEGSIDEPRVQIPIQKEDKVEPIRQNGRVIAVRVTPPGGKPYYLIDTSGNGNWMRRDSLDTGLAVPMFPILEFE
jgi:uncharacterized protein DUF2782